MANENDETVAAEADAKFVSSGGFRKRGGAHTPTPVVRTSRAATKDASAETGTTKMAARGTGRKSPSAPKATAVAETLFEVPPVAAVPRKGLTPAQIEAANAKGTADIKARFPLSAIRTHDETTTANPGPRDDHALLTVAAYVESFKTDGSQPGLAEFAAAQLLRDLAPTSAEIRPTDSREEIVNVCITAMNRSIESQGWPAVERYWRRQRAASIRLAKFAYRCTDDLAKTEVEHLARLILGLMVLEDTVLAAGAQPGEVEPVRAMRIEMRVFRASQTVLPLVLAKMSTD